CWSGGGLVRIFTEVANDAGWAFRLGGEAHVAAEQDQPVMRILAELRRRVGIERQLHLPRRTAGSEPGTVGDPEDMGVDGDLRLAEYHVENDVGGLPPDTGQCFELGTRRGNLAAVPVDELLREADEILRLRVVQAYRLDVRLDTLDTEGRDRRGRIGHRKEVARRGVDSTVSGVCGEHHGDQQLER